MDRSEKLSEYSALLSHHASLMLQLAKVERMREVWPEGLKGQPTIELYTTRLGGTGTVPLTRRYFMRDDNTKVKFEMTEDQWDYIFQEGKYEKLHQRQARRTHPEVGAD